MLKCGLLPIRELAPDIKSGQREPDYLRHWGLAIFTDARKRRMVPHFSQRREYFRVNVNFPVRYWHVAKDEAQIPPSVSVVRETINLSGGGMMIRVSTPLFTGKKLGLELDLPCSPRRRIRCVGQVVRIVSRGEKDLEVGLHFVEIDPDDRESIIVFCFAEQRRQLRDKVEVAGLNEEEM
jgi:c-di-GMP-binding flagellar brake protein YcgR